MWHVLQFATTRIISVSQGIWLPHLQHPMQYTLLYVAPPQQNTLRVFPPCQPPPPPGNFAPPQMQTGWLLIDCELLGSCHMKFESDILLLRTSLKSSVNKELQSPGMYVQGHSTGLGMFTQAHGWCSVPMLARVSYPLLPVVRGHLYQLKYC